MSFFAVTWMVLYAGAAIGQSAAPQAAQSNAAAADFAQKSRYAAVNAGLRGAARVVFLGDSVMEYWGSRAGTWFAQPGWVNRGIGGQTTAQLLLRERADALALEPAAVVLEGGSNDMRLGFPVGAIRDNLETMGELAEAHHARVYVAAMTPVCDCVRPLTGFRTVARIHELNAAIRSMCQTHRWGFVDLNTPLAGDDGLMRAEWTFDGVHPNTEGYNRLRPVVERVLGTIGKAPVR